MTDSFSLQHIIATWDHNILFSCTHTVTVTTDLTVWRLRSDLDYDFFHKLLLSMSFLSCNIYKLLMKAYTRALVC